MNGINEHGLAATSTLLLDRMPVFNKRPGLIHFVVVKRILQQAKTIDEAIDILKDTNRHSAWSMCLSDHKTDRICYLEYDADELEVRWLSGFYGSTNHCKLKQSVREWKLSRCSVTSAWKRCLINHPSTAAECDCLFRWPNRFCVISTTQPEDVTQLIPQNSQFDSRTLRQVSSCDPLSGKSGSQPMSHDPKTRIAYIV